MRRTTTESHHHNLVFSRCVAVGQLLHEVQLTSPSGAVSSVNGPSALLNSKSTIFDNGKQVMSPRISQR